MQLPVDLIVPDILKSLASRPCVVVTAPPGSGKTTRIPPALVGAFGVGRVLVSQPRRIAARSAAARMAEEQGSSLGKSIGFQTRFESKVCPESQLIVLTEGLLLRKIQSDPFLGGVSCVVLDEFHERSLDLDLTLAFLKEVISEARPDLKLIIMSATLEVEPLLNYLEDAVTLSAEARLFPIEVTHDRHRDEGRLEQRVSGAITDALNLHEGNLLAFLPGIAAIRKTKERLKALQVDQIADILELHGDLDAKLQDAAISKSGRRKVILSTNVAETSLTVPGVRIVVDSGLVKKLRHDSNLGLDRLEEERISLASARQRSGRAGREGPGFVKRLWTQVDERQMPEQDEAEVYRLELANAILQILSWGAPSVDDFDWFACPPKKSLQEGVGLLDRLGAIETDLETGKLSLTKLGQGLCSLPIHPRLGVLLHEADARGVGDLGALACALLSERDLLSMDQRRGLGQKLAAPSDLQLRIDLVESDDRQIHRGGRARVRKVAKQLRRFLGTHSGPKPTHAAEALSKAVLAAFPDRLAKRRDKDRTRGLMVGGRGVQILEESVVKDGDLFCALRLSAGRRGKGSDSPVTWLQWIDESWLEEDFSHGLRTKDEGAFDEAKGRVIFVRRKRFFDLILDERQVNVTDGAAAGEILAQAVRQHDQTILARIVDRKTDSLLQRLAFLREHSPEFPWPKFEGADLIELIVSLCPGRSRFSELEPQDLRRMIEASIGFQLMTRLKQEAPVEFQLENGRKLKVAYTPGAPPTISSKVQHFFGQWETPSFVGGRVKARVELLAPNRRPVQITSDLANFWRTTYAQVRKDLRGRYPKHDWPENPPGS